MVKLIVFFKRKPEISVENFQKHWRTRHAELVLRLPGLRRYVQNHTLPSGYRRGEPDYDGVAEAWFDDVAALSALEHGDERAAILADEPAFIDPARMGTLLAREVTIVDGPAPVDAAKMISFLNKRSDVSVEQFQRHWRDVHGPIAARIPGNHRYVQCHVHPASYEAGPAPRYDGVPMSWFDDVDALRRSAATPEYAATRADEVNFMISGRLPFVIAREHVIR